MVWDDGLLGPHRNIGACNERFLRVLAGPGTGKTFAFIRRVARLLEDGIDPNRILVTTFTRTAAQDLREQLAQMDAPGRNDVETGTLHSLCFRILGRAEVLEITGRVPRPIITFERSKILRYEGQPLVEDLDNQQFGGRRSRTRLVRAYEAGWARLLSDVPGWPQDQVDRNFHTDLVRWLRFHQAILIGEIVPQTLVYLRMNPGAPERARFDHVVVDEYQDLNRAEQALLDLLAGGNALAVVGDNNQSIYRFKYAHPEGILDFGDHHPGTYDEPLTECRRCPTRIVALANSLIANNPEGTQRQIVARDGNPEGEIHIVQWNSLDEEAQGLAAYVVRAVADQDVQPNRVLVLSPRRQIGYRIRDALNAAGIPAHSLFHEESLDSDEAQRNYSLLTLLAYPEDRVALRHWLGIGSPTCRSGRYRRLRDHCEHSGISPRQALQLLESGELAIPYSGELVQRFRLLREVTEPLQGLVGPDLLDALFPAENEWSAPMRAAAQSLGNEPYNPNTLRETLRLQITQPELPVEDDFARVMSLHKSKGLTADLVIVADCVDGLIPTVDHDLPIAEQEETLQEQRRLFYVAITRTRSILVLSSTRTLPRAFAYGIGARVIPGLGQLAPALPSPFLAQLGNRAPAAIAGGEWLEAMGI